MLGCLRCRAQQHRTVVSAISTSEGRARRTDRFKDPKQAVVSHNSSGRKQEGQSATLEPVQSAQQQVDWLAKVLATAGLASRRKCIELVKQGAVKVNGQVVTDPATKVDPSKDVLAAHGRIVKQPAAAGYHYFAVNKPPGYICSNTSAKAPGKRAVDILQPWLDDWQRKHPVGPASPRLFTVGRLDVATSGLIFITNNGNWANKVIHPSANIIKEYHVTLPQQPTPQQLQILRAGTAVGGVHCQPKVVKVLRQAGSTNGGQQSSDSGSLNKSKDSGRCLLQIDVSEGKKHEVRILVAAAGLTLLALKRVRVGGFVMPRNISKGGYMKLQLSDLDKVFQQPRMP